MSSSFSLQAWRVRSAVLIGSVIGSVGFAAAASAHIDPDPKEAQAGSEQSVGFTVQHGCEGSPTVELAMRLPDGVTTATPEPLDGWNGSIDGSVVTFTGGPLPDDQMLTFRVQMTLPPTPDLTIYFPFVQRCEVGEIRWIDQPTDGSTTELDEPAPAMRLVGPVAAPVTTTTPPTTTPPTTSPPTTTPPTTTPPNTPPTTTDLVTTSAALATTSSASTSATEATATLDAPIANSDDSSQAGSSTSTSVASTGGPNGGTLAFVMTMAGVAAIGGLIVRSARKGR